MTPEEFRIERMRLKLSQAELGAAFGKPRQTIARWERGDMAIQHPAIMRLAFEALVAHQAKRNLVAGVIIRG